MRSLTLTVGLLGLIFPLLTKAQPFRLQNERAPTEQNEEIPSDDLIQQVLDLNFLFQGDEQLPYSTKTSPWGGALLPDPSYDPNYRVPESERIYPPGYLERKKKPADPVR